MDYFLLAILATLGYSVQNTLMASFYRSMDRLSAVTYRGFSLTLSMWPLLLWVQYPMPPLGLRFALCILGAAITAAAANWYGANAYSFLPVGIATALSTSFTAIVTAVIGYFGFRESLSPAQLTFLAGTLLGIFLLGAAKSSGPLPAEYNVPRGILHSLLFGLLLGVAYVLVGLASRQYPAFFVGYLWEATIGLIAASAALARGALGGASLSRIPARQFARILVCSSPTVIGTGCYAMATTTGKIGIVTAVLSTMMVFNTLLAMFLYKERPTRWQWCLLVVVCLMVIGLKLSTDTRPEPTDTSATTASARHFLPPVSHSSNSFAGRLSCPTSSSAPLSST